MTSDVTDDLVIALMYYSPYVSGLTNVARDVAEGLVRRGRRVTVVATRSSPDLAREEVINGVRVVRTPVIARIGRGAVSPTFAVEVVKATARAKVANLHLPLLEAGPITRFSRCPVVLTYHCDVSLPPGLLNSAQTTIMDASSRIAMRHATAVTVTSEDYAQHSRLWRSIQPSMVAIPPPIEPVPTGRPAYRETNGLHVGFLGRIVQEKGLDHLVRGFRNLDDPDARLLIGGDFSQIAGGSVVEQVRQAIGGDPRARMLGFVPDDRLGDFYASLDVFALPSVNAFEAFGIVQAVAMLAGVPVLASNLPGVRLPVQQTGFGAIVPPGDSDAIGVALAKLAANPPDRERGAAAARDSFWMNNVLDAYEAVLDKAASTE